MQLTTSSIGYSSILVVVGCVALFVGIVTAIAYQTRLTARLSFTDVGDSCININKSIDMN